MHLYAWLCLIQFRKIQRDCPDVFHWSSERVILVSGKVTHKEKPWEVASYELTWYRLHLYSQKNSTLLSSQPATYQWIGKTRHTQTQGHTWDSLQKLIISIQLERRPFFVVFWGQVLKQVEQITLKYSFLGHNDLGQMHICSVGQG